MAFQTIVLFQIMSLCFLKMSNGFKFLLVEYSTVWVMRLNRMYRQNALHYTKVPQAYQEHLLTGTVYVQLLLVSGVDQRGMREYQSGGL